MKRILLVADEGPARDGLAQALFEAGETEIVARTADELTATEPPAAHLAVIGRLAEPGATSIVRLLQSRRLPVVRLGDENRDALLALWSAGVDQHLTPLFDPAQLAALAAGAGAE